MYVPGIEKPRCYDDFYIKIKSNKSFNIPFGFCLFVVVFLSSNYIFEIWGSDLSFKYATRDAIL